MEGKILSLKQEKIPTGRSRRSVAAELHLAESSVRHIYNRYLDTGSYDHRPRSGRPRCTDAREDRKIVRSALRDPFATATTLAGRANESREDPISSRTVLRRLNEQGINSFSESDDAVDSPPGPEEVDTITSNRPTTRSTSTHIECAMIKYNVSLC